MRHGPSGGASEARDVLRKLEPTPVYDSYWQFAAERQAIFVRRLAGIPSHWTDDPLLLLHKFTNAYRVLDRTTQFLISEVIDGDCANRDPIDMIFRVLLFKLFNKIDTWQLLERELGPLLWATFSRSRCDRVLANAMSRGQRIYSGAYIMPAVAAFGDQDAKHSGHLQLVDVMMRAGFARAAQATMGLEQLFKLLRSYPSLGPFLAYQYAIDISYSTVVPHREEEFVVAGPGAIDGIAKCFARAADMAPHEIISMVCAAQESEFEGRHLTFAGIKGRPLQLVDCQNLFCEISKYARVAHPDYVGVSGRKRIKQGFHSRGELLPLRLPPKWGLPTVGVASFAHARSVVGQCQDDSPTAVVTVR